MTRTQEQVELFVKLFKKGVSAKTISAMCGIPYRTTNHWIKTMKDNRSLAYPIQNFTKTKKTKKSTCETCEWRREVGGNKIYCFWRSCERVSI